MLKIEQHGPVTVFRMGRHVASRRWVLYEAHAFLIDDTMIDTGTIAVRNERETKLDGLRCSTIVNTRHHEDHIGNNRLFQDRFGAEIYAHPGALAFLEKPRLIGMQLYRRVVWNTPDPSRGRPVGDTVSTSRRNLQVILAPGHSPDHICLYEPAAMRRRQPSPALRLRFGNNTTGRLRHGNHIVEAHIPTVDPEGGRSVFERHLRHRTGLPGRDGQVRPVGSGR
jgi:hypothetical protein